MTLRASAPSRACAYFCAALILVLAGCATQPLQKPGALLWDQRKAELQQRQQFDLAARIAVAAGQEGFNANLRWVQRGAHSQLSLEGPLGVGGAQISLDGETLQVSTSRGANLTDAAAREELNTRLGFEPPLASLRYWILGVPDPQAPPAEETLNVQQRLAELHQNEWRVVYESYNADGADWLPRKLTLTREGVRVRVVVLNWKS